MCLTDAALATEVAWDAGELLVALREEVGLYDLGDTGDKQSNALILQRLRDERPGDAVLSEEAVARSSRCRAAMTGRCTHHRNRHCRRRRANLAGQRRPRAASLAISAGANVKAVQRMLGHARASMTLDVYADLFDSDLDSVVANLDAAIRSAADWLRAESGRLTANYALNC